MAKINATELFRFENFDPETTQGKVVGNNRTVTHRVRYKTDDGGVTRKSCKEIIGSLHGHPVFTLRKRYNPDFDDIEYVLKLDNCGHATRTTRDAIDEFMTAAGFKAGVSMAGGELSCNLFFKDGGSHLLKSGGSIIVTGLTQKDWDAFNTICELA